MLAGMVDLHHAVSQRFADVEASNQFHGRTVTVVRG
jgi:hypothetical protein